MKSRPFRWLFNTLVILIGFYAVLLIPGTAPPEPAPGEKKPFAWNQDEYWSQLESQFKEVRTSDCAELASDITARFSEIEKLMMPVSSAGLYPTDTMFEIIEDRFFQLSVLLAACPEKLPDYLELFSRLRKDVKAQSIAWDMNSGLARDRTYRLLYGGRTAVEEIMMQAGDPSVPEVVPGTAETSATPSAEILGVVIHSGDILVSRGGAPTSALIARGNDYPGNFSHIALAYVDSLTHKVSIIESHIEMGVAIADIEKYLKDTKLRVMVLRLRSDLPEMRADPLLPHRAAEYALRRAETELIPYDFAMDFEEPSKLFCSEVVSDAYGHVGVGLWAGLSHISSVGVKAWLAAFGVENFTTQEPSDLEYDPQLRVVAEWRDFETLYKDRLDNAVVDIMLESAEKGERLGCDWYRLPLARIAKAYSVILNQFGGVGPVPEGMDASAALRNEWFSARHNETKEKLLLLAQQFKETNGYAPPYWELIKLARRAYTYSPD